ncbi:MAG: hypothetical protein HQ530_02345 [Parcubacteria group bacterium]|nr:hypothetical protein [Parcubacteria group bacterium]
MKQKLSLDFIAGLICGEGCFTSYIQNEKQKIFAFSLKMHVCDKELVIAIRDSLGLRESVHEYFHQERHYVVLNVRKRRIVENIIIPTFNGKLFGMKKKQFEKWRDDYYKDKDIRERT